MEHNAHNGHSDQYIFQQAEGEGLAAAVELPGTVVLPHEGGTGLTERVKGIIGDDLNVECCTGCRNHHGAEAVDGRLHNDVGKGKHGALDAGRQADLDDLAEAGMVKLQGVGAHTNCRARMGQAVEQEQRTDRIGDHRGDGNTVDRHLQHDDEEQIQHNIQHAGKGQGDQRRPIM